MVQHFKMSCDMWFPTMWHFDKCRFRWACPFQLRKSKWYSVSSLTLQEYSSDKQRLWSDCAYAQADLRLWWSHIPHCWKSHVAAQIISHIIGVGNQMGYRAQLIEMSGCTRDWVQETWKKILNCMVRSWSLSHVQSILGLIFLVPYPGIHTLTWKLAMPTICIASYSAILTQRCQRCVKRHTTPL